jgi:hypothetical protein
MLRRGLTIAGAAVALALLGTSIYAAGIAFGLRSAARSSPTIRISIRACPAYGISWT